MGSQYRASIDTSYAMQDDQPTRGARSSSLRAIWPLRERMTRPAAPLKTQTRARIAKARDDQ